MQLERIPLTTGNRINALVYEDAEILCLREENGSPVLYVTTSGTAPRVTWSFNAHQAGQTVAGGSYVGSYAIPSGVVWHVFQAV